MPKSSKIQIKTQCLLLPSCTTLKSVYSFSDQSTIVIYASRVVPDLKIPHITTLES